MIDLKVVVKISNVFIRRPTIKYRYTLAESKRSRLLQLENVVQACPSFLKCKLYKKCKLHFRILDANLLESNDCISEGILDLEEFF
jgi:hypothetical protein